MTPSPKTSAATGWPPVSRHSAAERPWPLRPPNVAPGASPSLRVPRPVARGRLRLRVPVPVRYLHRHPGDVGARVRARHGDPAQQHPAVPLPESQGRQGPPGAGVAWRTRADLPRVERADIHVTYLPPPRRKKDRDPFASARVDDGDDALRSREGADRRDHVGRDLCQRLAQARPEGHLRTAARHLPPRPGRGAHHGGGAMRTIALRPLGRSGGSGKPAPVNEKSPRPALTTRGARAGGSTSRARSRETGVWSGSGGTPGWILRPIYPDDPRHVVVRVDVADRPGDGRRAGCPCAPPRGSPSYQPGRALPRSRWPQSSAPAASHRPRRSVSAYVGQELRSRPHLTLMVAWSDSVN